MAHKVVPILFIGLVIVFVIVLAVSCGSKPVPVTSETPRPTAEVIVITAEPTSAVKEHRFLVISEEAHDGIHICVVMDKKTGVYYMITPTGISTMYNELGDVLREKDKTENK